MVCSAGGSCVSHLAHTSAVAQQSALADVCLCGAGLPALVQPSAASILSFCPPVSYICFASTWLDNRFFFKAACLCQVFSKHSAWFSLKRQQVFDVPVPPFAHCLIML